MINGGAWKQTEYVDDGIPVVQVSNMKNGAIDVSDLKFLPPNSYDRYKKHTLKEWDLVIATVGSHATQASAAGRATIVKGFVAGMLLNQNAVAIRSKVESLDQGYLGLIGRSDKFKFYLGTVGQGAANQVRIALSAIKEYKCDLPPIGVQRRIAEVISAYDGLIENNRRRIQLLEQAARLLYKEWFVHLRFPGHEHVTITDGVPEGWEKKPLGGVFLALESGGRPKGGAQEDGIPSVGAENVIGIGRYDYSKEKYVPEIYFNSMRKGIIQSRDVLVYKDGANIGRSSYFGDGFPHETCAVNEHVFILRASPQVGQNLLYFWVEQDETRQRIANLNANTAQPGVSQSKLKTLDFVVPQDRIASIFNETVEPIVRQIFLLAKEVQALITARDLLLPRLMNGGVAV